MEVGVGREAVGLGRALRKRKWGERDMIGRWSREQRRGRSPTVYGPGCCYGEAPSPILPHSPSSPHLPSRKLSAQDRGLTQPPREYLNRGPTFSQFLSFIFFLNFNLHHRLIPLCLIPTYLTWSFLSDILENLQICSFVLWFF